MVFELTAGDDRATVDETAGGRLSSLVAGGAERLLKPDDDPFMWGCYPMAPWAGRVAGAHVAGTDVRLQANHGPHAMHGVVYDGTWTVDDAADDRLALHCAFPPSRWPFGGRAEQEIRLAPGRLTLELRVRADELAMPAAVGWHPWFRRPAEGDMRVRVPATTVLETTDDLIPTGELRPADGELDLRDGPLLGARYLDHTYVDVDGDADVVWPDLVLTVGLPTNADTFVVHTPARGVCVEPQTAWPDPFARPDRAGVTRLAPGEVLTAVTTWRWRAP